MPHRIALLVSIVVALAACSSGNGRRRSNLAEIDLASTDESPILDLGVTGDHATAADLSMIGSATSDLSTSDLLTSDLSMIDASPMVDLPTSDLVQTPTDLTPGPADLTFVFGVAPWFKTFHASDTKLYPDHPILISGTIMPGTVGANVTQVELIDDEGRVYAQTVTTPVSGGQKSISLHFGWATVNAVEAINTATASWRKFSLRLIASDGNVYPISWASVSFRCLNDIDACSGQCGDCPGPTFTECRPAGTVTATDSCFSYCQTLGKSCSNFCAWETYSYNTGNCDSAKPSGRTSYQVHSSCNTLFGGVTPDGIEISKAAISCCCQ